MTLDDIIANILSGGALLAGIAAVIGALRSRRAGVKSDEREARKEEATQRRDTIADRDSLIDQLQDEVGTLRDRMDKFENAYELEKEYNRLLVDHIYKQKPPPPPPRPTRLEP